MMEHPIIGRAAWTIGAAAAAAMSSRMLNLKARCAILDEEPVVATESDIQLAIAANALLVETLEAIRDRALSEAASQ